MQQPVKTAGLPVVVLIEGWGAAGKGSLIRSLIRELDPRLFQVVSMSEPGQEERRWPFLKRYCQAMPERGKVLFLDSGWMNDTVRERLRGDLSDEEYRSAFAAWSAWSASWRRTAIWWSSCFST